MTNPTWNISYINVKCTRKKYNYNKFFLPGVPQHPSKQSLSALELTSSSQLPQYSAKASQWHSSSRSKSPYLTFESQPRTSSKTYCWHTSPPKNGNETETVLVKDDQDMESKSEIDEEDIFDNKKSTTSTNTQATTVSDRAAIAALAQAVPVYTNADLQQVLG